MLCSKCGSDNPSEAWFCANCGNAISGAVPGEAQPAAARRQAQAEEATDFDREAYAAVIGPKNTDYYLRRFEAFQRGGGSIGWHWPAFFVTLFWLMYRRQWLHALLYFVAPYAVLVPIALLAALSPALGGAVYLLAVAGFFIVPALYASRWYYAHCTRQLERGRQRMGSSREAYLGWLAGSGGTSPVAAIIIGVLFLIGVIGILAAIAIPAYQDYTLRARFAQAIDQGRAASRAVEAHYLRTGQVPGSLAEAGYEPSGTVAFAQYSLNARSARIAIRVALPGSKQGTVLLVPTQGADQSITWSCGSPDVPARLLPTTCRDAVGEQP